MKKHSFVMSMVVLLVVGFFSANGVLVCQDNTNAIGGPANPTSQTGWWFSINSKVGIQHVDKADMAQIAAQNVAQMKVVDPVKLREKGFTNIKAGDMVQVKRVSEKQAKIKLLPDGPEKTINF
jgi:hypothetical protein